MGIVEDMAREYGINNISIVSNRLLPSTIGWTEDGTFVIGKYIQNFFELLVERMPELKEGIRYIILHEKGHEIQREKMRDVPTQYREMQANLYASDKANSPLKDIAAAEFLYSVLNHGSILGVCKSKVRSTVLERLDANYPFLSRSASRKIVENAMDMAKKFNFI